MWKRARRHLGACVVMFIGCGIVMSMLLAMNARPSLSKVRKHGVPQSFVIKRQRKPPKRRRARRRRPRPRRARRMRTPAPQLSTSLSNVSLGMSNLALGTMDGDSDRLLGGRQDSRDLVMTEKTVDQPPQPTRRIAPQYPPRARAQNISGYVLFRLLIGPSGDIEQVKILKSQPEGVFDGVASAAIQRWHFRPAMYKGQPVKSWIRQRLSFRLQ